MLTGDTLHVVEYMENKMLPIEWEVWIAHSKYSVFFQFTWPGDGRHMVSWQVCKTSNDFVNVRISTLLMLLKCKFFITTTHLTHLLLSSVSDFTDSNLFFSLAIVVMFSWMRRIPPDFGFKARQAVLQYSWQDGIKPKLTWSATPTGQT